MSTRMVERQTSISPSPSRRLSLSSKLSVLGAKLNRTFSGDHTLVDGDRRSIDSTMLGSDKDRSLSRGREAFQSSGRGGLGNIRQASASREARTDGADDFYSSRGREPIPAATRLFSTGRGGAGNIRSPSRDINKAPLGPELTEAEEAAIRGHAAAHETLHSTGRGGVGNIGTSRSRSRGPALPMASNVHSTGRGGVGNIVLGDGLISEVIDEEERMAHVQHTDGVHPHTHSTSRGGVANILHNPGPNIEHPTHSRGEYESTGRGGAGNIVHDRSASRSRR